MAEYIYAYFGTTQLFKMIGATGKPKSTVWIIDCGELDPDEDISEELDENKKKGMHSTDISNFLVENRICKVFLSYYKIGKKTTIAADQEQTDGYDTEETDGGLRSPEVATETDE